MKNFVKYLLFTVAGLTIAFSASAEKYKGDGGSKNVTQVKSTAAGCFQGSAFKYIDINNVRTRINAGGDMWWDFEKGDYEIPKGSGKTSMFSASLWIGGYDPAGNLKLAAIRYRQGPDIGPAGTGTDYWPGPLSIDGTASVDQSTCDQWDKIYTMTREEVDDFLAWREDPASFPEYKIPKSILEWPAHGDVSLNQSYYMAPFFDENNDGLYNPGDGDYPYYDIQNNLCGTKTPTMDESQEGSVAGSVLSDQILKGDMTLWNVFNDKGNVHTETEGSPIGLEIRGQVFGFATNDEINDMTFYSYEIINRSTTALTGTYFSQWVDTDLGYANDDYVGCDVERGLGYCYNGTPVDGSGQPFAYGENPPAVGVDFFQGPYMDPDGYDNPAYKKNNKLGPNIDDCSIVTNNNTIQTFEYGDGLSGNFLVRAEAINGVNFGDSIIDNERFGMRRFVYHNNQSNIEDMTDPKRAPEYYLLLTGRWKNGQAMAYGGNAYNTSYGPETDFMFPGDSDPCFWGTHGEAVDPSLGPINWTEENSGENSASNPPGDRRFMQSAGPFTLNPGAVNYITVGIPWARANSGSAWASVELLRQADDKCQNLFDNCFQVVNGPNAPDVTIRELDRKLVLYLTNRKTADAGNNYKEGYQEYDFNIVPPDSLGADNRWDTTYNFEGYQVFQLISPTVSVADIYDPAKSRLVYQCDLKNNVSRLINFESDQYLGALVPQEKVNGANEGIKNSVLIEKDAFTNKKLVNNKQYYYLAIAYAYNEYYKYSADPSFQILGQNDLSGQKTPYLAGRKNIKVYTGIPHEQVGRVRLNADYGTGIEVTRIEGQGNGGNWLELDDETVADILSKEPASETNVVGDASYPIAYEATYKPGHSPIVAKVIDPLKVKKGEYIVRFDTLKHIVLENFTEQPGVEGDTLGIDVANWTLEDAATGDIYYSDTTIAVTKEQIFLDLGISISATQTPGPGHYFVGLIPNPDPNTADKKIRVAVREDEGFLGSDFEYADPLKTWMTGLHDVDADLYHRNWIRSGTSYVGFGDTADIKYTNGSLDEQEMYESLFFNEVNEASTKLVGTWAPYVMTAHTTMMGGEWDFAPSFSSTSIIKSNYSRLRDLNSVDVVFTSDKSKWTRCIVLEQGNDVDSTEGRAKHMTKRQGKSVNINGETDVVSDDPTLNSNYIDSIGMGWFPGYAIDVETGERLNMAFGEDSRLVDDNGRDMIWNPTSREFDADANPVIGGRHTVYVMRSADLSYHFVQPGLADTVYSIHSGPYDAGYEANKYIGQNKFMINIGGNELPLGDPKASPRGLILGSCTWVGVPMLSEGFDLLETDLKLSFRVTRPYQKFWGAEFDEQLVEGDNAHYPMYRISTATVAPTEDLEKEEKDLEMIRVVPNPYYGYSTYEVNQLDNRVKITNLPEKCTVSIYTVNGSLVRQFKKADPVTFIDWDLKNFASIPISGGLYYIHVDAGDAGEHVVRFYAVMRPVDLNSF